MLAIVGVLPILAYLGYAAAALAVATIAGCDSGKPPKEDGDITTDGDVPPVDDDVSGPDPDGVDDDHVDDDIADGDIVDDDVADVEEDDDAIVDPDDDIVDGDSPDDDIDEDQPDDDADIDPGCADVRTGFNPCVADVSGRIRDLDAIAGGVTAFGGAIPSVFRCTTNGLSAATCETKAELTDGLEASQYHSTPFGYAVATAVPQGLRSPVTMFKIDEAAATPDAAVLGQKELSQLTISSGSDPVVSDLNAPGGIAALQTTAVPTERFFVGFDATTDGASTGLVGAFANFDGDWVSVRSPGFPKGRNTMGMGATTLNLGSGDKAYVVAANAGVIDDTDAFQAGIAVFDPEASSLLRVKLCGLGEATLATIPEIAFDATGRKAYVMVESPSPALKRINLETCAEEMNLAIEANLGGAVVDMAVDGTTVYLADTGSKKIIFVDTTTPALLGSVLLPEAPDTLAVSGARLFFTWGAHLGALDPATVELAVE